MVDKASGKVSYTVLSSGDFMGIGDDYYPLPWPSLKYDTGLGGYISGISLEKLSDDATWNWSDPARAKSLDVITV